MDGFLESEPTLEVLVVHFFTFAAGLENVKSTTRFRVEC